MTRPQPLQNNRPMPRDVDTSDEHTWRGLFPFEPHFAEIAGQRMHYLDERPAAPSDASTQPTLLFVHGNPTWSFHWRELIRSLSAKYRCVAPDHLGCGRSDRPSQLLRLADRIEHLATFTDRLDLRNVTLVAQDWGGAIGLGTMLRLPKRFRRIVLFNTGAFRPRYLPWRIRMCRVPLLGRLAVQGANLFSRAALRMTLARRARLDPRVSAGYLAPYDSWPNRRAVYEFVEDIPSGPRHPTWHTLTQIEADLPTLADRPALLVWGMRDWCFRPDCLERFVQAWPHAEVHRLPDVGHWVVEDATEDVVPLVESFLTATASSSRTITAVEV